MIHSNNPAQRQPLCVVTGSCQGIEIKLDSSNISFGAVVKGTSVVRRVLLENSGDIGVKYQWAAARFLPHFSISPVCVDRRFIAHFESLTGLIDGRIRSCQC